MDYNNFLELVKSRRSIRKIKPDPIPDDYIDKIIEAARYAPSGANTQPWEFLVIKKQELKDKIVEIINEMKRRDGVDGETRHGTGTARASHAASDVSQAPVFIMLLGDERLRMGLPGQAGQDDRKWQSVLTSSLASAFLYMHLAATSLGLGSMWQSGVERPDARQKLGNLLGLPDELHIYDMMVIGFPDAGPSPKVLRERAEMVHFDYCRKANIRTDAQVQAFIRTKNQPAAQPGSGKKE